MVAERREVGVGQRPRENADDVLSRAPSGGDIGPTVADENHLGSGEIEAGGEVERAAGIGFGAESAVGTDQGIERVEHPHVGKVVARRPLGGVGEDADAVARGLEHRQHVAAAGHEDLFDGGGAGVEPIVDRLGRPSGAAGEVLGHDVAGHGDIGAVGRETLRREIETEGGGHAVGGGVRGGGEVGKGSGQPRLPRGAEVGECPVLVEENGLYHRSRSA